MSADNMPPLPASGPFWQAVFAWDEAKAPADSHADAVDAAVYEYARAYAAEQTRELVGSVGALLFVVRALATELGIDPETTEFRFSADGKEFAQTTLSTICENADAILAKHKAQS